jgi:SPP1 family predicted phage head-tail adaptor
MLKSKQTVARLDREITFIEPTIVVGTSNEDKITAWVEIDTDPDVSARKMEEGGNTSVNADRVTNTKQTSWVIRYRDDLNVRMRIVYETKVYEILNISESDETRKRYLTILSQSLDNEFFT